MVVTVRLRRATANATAVRAIDRISPGRGFLGWRWVSVGIQNNDRPAPGDRDEKGGRRISEPTCRTSNGAMALEKCRVHLVACIARQTLFGSQSVTSAITPDRTCFCSRFDWRAKAPEEGNVAQNVRGDPTPRKRILDYRKSRSINFLRLTIVLPFACLTADVWARNNCPRVNAGPSSSSYR